MDLFRRPGLLLLPIAFLAFGERPAAASAGTRLLAPRAGAELAAGSLAEVAWEGSPPAGAEEWEAFLSLDGGRTYPLRITPHLDLGIRRFTVRVPPFPTRDARVLLRFGDERREVEIETAQRFAIVAAAAALPPDLGTALSRGEKARSRDSGVVVWVEGARDGSGVREVAAEGTDCDLRSVETGRLHWLPLFWPSRHRAGLAAPALAARFLRTPDAARLRTEALAASPLLPSVRLLTGRLNE
jgi:hypothetical protein